MLNSDDARQTKIWMQSCNKRFARSFLNIQREELGIQMLTGHNRLNHHETLIGKSNDPLCRFCSEEEETSFHLLARCPAFMLKCYGIFDHHELDENPDWNPVKFTCFLQRTKMAEIDKRVP